MLSSPAEEISLRPWPIRYWAVPSTNTRASPPPRSAPPKAGERSGDAKAEQRAGQQARPVPEPFARRSNRRTPRGATRRSSGKTAGSRRRLRSAFQPVALHDDAVGEPLVHPVVVAGVVDDEAADRRRRCTPARTSSTESRSSRRRREGCGACGGTGHERPRRPSSGERPSREPDAVGLHQPADQAATRRAVHASTATLPISASAEARSTAPAARSGERRNPSNPRARRADRSATAGAPSWSRRDQMSCPFQRGTSAHRSPVSTPSIETKCTPRASADGTADGDAVDAHRSALTSGPVSICSDTGRRARPGIRERCIATVASGGRSAGDRPAVAVAAAG